MKSFRKDRAFLSCLAVSVLAAGCSEGPTTVEQDVADVALSMHEQSIVVVDFVEAPSGPARVPGPGACVTLEFSIISHPRTYVESGIRVTAPNHLHIHGTHLFIHTSSSSPVSFVRVDGQPFTLKSITVRSGGITFTSSLGAVLGAGPGTVTFPTAGWSSITSFTANSRSASMDKVIICPAIIDVDIDIKPGSDPNSVNTTIKGTIPVAILTTASFDAADVDARSVTLGDDDGNDTPVATRKNGSLRANLEDVDGDGDLDMILHFDTQALVANGDLTTGTTALILNGKNLAGTPIKGSDAVNIVP